MNGDMIIEPIAERHISGFRDALDSVARERKYLAWTEAPPLGEVAEFVKSNIRDGVIQFVAVDGGRVVGWCDIIAYGKPIFAHTGRLGIGVVASHRGKGVGAALLREALARAKSKGLVRIELNVYADNERAIELYRRFGFIIEGRKVRSSFIDGKYLDDYMMAMFLD